MNNKKTENLEDDMRPEYDLSQLKGRVRGKYVERYREGTNLVLLESDVQAAFPDAEAVNEALRMLMKVARRQDVRTGLIVPQQMPNKSMNLRQFALNMIKSKFGGKRFYV